MNETRADKLLRGYLTCALWSSTTMDDVPLDRGHNLTDFTASAMEKSVLDCAAFFIQAEELIASVETNTIGRTDIWEMAGYDFWLTRNGHGAGFWDGDWDKLPYGMTTVDLGPTLTRIAKAFGEVILVEDGEQVDIL